MIHIRGANQTFRIFQFRIESCVTSSSDKAQKYEKKRIAMNHLAFFEPREGATDNGKPKVTASNAAREKFRTDVMETSVDARHRLRDLITMDVGATKSP